MESPAGALHMSRSPTVITNRLSLRSPPLSLTIFAHASGYKCSQLCSPFGRSYRVSRSGHNMLLLLFRNHLINPTHCRQGFDPKYVRSNASKLVIQAHQKLINFLLLPLSNVPGRCIARASWGFE
ncbi:hypothetical protein CRG98_049626, partial [Punica granatum]